MQRSSNKNFYRGFIILEKKSYVFILRTNYFDPHLLFYNESHRERLHFFFVQYILELEFARAVCKFFLHNTLSTLIVVCSIIPTVPLLFLRFVVPLHKTRFFSPPCNRYPLLSLSFHFCNAIFIPLYTLKKSRRRRIKEKRAGARVWLERRWQKKNVVGVENDKLRTPMDHCSDSHNE